MSAYYASITFAEDISNSSQGIFYAPFDQNLHMHSFSDFKRGNIAVYVFNILYYVKMFENIRAKHILEK